MTILAGVCLLIIFVLCAVWFMIRFTLEANHNIKSKIKKNGHHGNYYTYKKQFKKQSKK